MAFLQPSYIVDRWIGSGFDAAVIAIAGLMLGNLGVAKAIGLLLGSEQLDILTQRTLVTFERENVIGFLVENFLGDVALAAHGVDGDDGAFDRQHVEKCGDGDDFVGFVRHFDLAEHEALAGREGGHHMDRGFAALLVGRTAQRLAVEGDHICRYADQFGNPGDEAALELRGVEGGENVAKVVVRWRPILKRQEPAQQCDLLLAKPRYVDEGFRPGKHREQTQQQDLLKRIDHLAALPRVRKIRKITQKNNRFALRRKYRRFHRPLRTSNQRAMTDSELQSLVTSEFTRLPCQVKPKPLTLSCVATGCGSGVRPNFRPNGPTLASTARY